MLRKNSRTSQYIKRTVLHAHRSPCARPKFQAPVLLSYEQVAIQPNRTRPPILIRNGTARTQATIKAIERARARVVHTQRACCTASLSWCAPSRFHQYAPAAPTAPPITYRSAARSGPRLFAIPLTYLSLHLRCFPRSAAQRTHARTHALTRTLARPCGLPPH